VARWLADTRCDGQVWREYLQADVYRRGCVLADDFEDECAEGAVGLIVSVFADGMAMRSTG